MLITISPAKTLDFETSTKISKRSKPLMLDQAATLVEIMKKKRKGEIVKLMGVSDKIADLNVDRYRRWPERSSASDSKPAIFAFMGDVYTGLDARSFDADAIEFAQRHLRILSGLYGILRPLDTMKAYRLEMGTKLCTEKGQNLYDFWGDQITTVLNKHAKSINSQFLVNLASEEYFKVVNKELLNTELITPVFKDKKNGKYKIISFFAKKARGMMARFIIENRITKPSNLADFCAGGYYLDSTSSVENAPVFLREDGVDGH